MSEWGENTPYCIVCDSTDKACEDFAACRECTEAWNNKGAWTQSTMEWIVERRRKLAAEALHRELVEKVIEES